MRSSTKSIIAGVALSLTMVWQPPVSATQDGDFSTRDMQDGALFQSRPKPKRGRSHRPRRYTPTGGGAAASAAPAKSDTEIGITIWRMRPALPGDPRDIVHDSSEAGTLTPVRVLGDEKLAVGDRFRFAIESSRHGFLYVVNRPVYDGGPARPPALIFPTLRIRGGVNAIGGGALIELPTEFDAPTYFTIRGRGEGKLVAEEVMLLVTPKPLDLEIGGGPIVLPAETIAEWERRWGAAAERFEYSAGSGMFYTSEEQAARRDPAYRIDRNGPAPQLLFRIPGRGDSPVFLRIRIPIGDPAAAGEGR